MKPNPWYPCKSKVTLNFIGLNLPAGLGTSQESNHNITTSYLFPHHFPEFILLQKFLQICLKWFSLLWSIRTLRENIQNRETITKRSCILTWQFKVKFPPKGSHYEFLFSSLHDPKGIRHWGQATHENTQTLGKQPQSNDFKRCLLEKLDITRGAGRKQVIQSTCRF